MPAYKIKSGPSKGILAHRFMSPPNKDGNKRRIYVQCPPEYNTHVFLQKLEREAIERHMSGLFTTGDTFASYVRERFLVEYPAARNLKKSSRDLLTYLFEKIALPHLGSTPLASIDAGAVARFTAKLQEATKETKKTGTTGRAYSDQTIRLTVVAIVSVLRWAAKLGDLAKRPEIVVPKVETARRPKPYSRDESRKLIAAARDKIEHAVFLLIYDAGMRKSEILGLTREQVDFDTGILLIDRQRYRGVDQKTKSGRPRSFEMTPEIVGALKAIRHLRSEYVFADKDGRPFPEYWLRWVFYRARTKAGLRHTRIHDGRHHLATRASAAGMSVYDLRELMGHADVRTTQGYTHPAPSLPTSVLGAAVSR